MVKTFFNALSGDHRIKDHEDYGGYKTKTEAQTAYKEHSYRRGKSDASYGRSPEYKDAPHHKSEYMRGYKEHQASNWGDGKGNPSGDVK